MPGRGTLDRRDAGMLLITFSDVTFSYGGTLVLDEVSLDIQHGDKIGIVGENGSGKSTLVRLAVGEEQPLEGTVEIEFTDAMRGTTCCSRAPSEAPGARWARPSSAGTRRASTRWTAASSAARSPRTS